ncbi:MAG TPA: hypothetical protein VMZ27_06910 [Candidatus Saccharimonadales bacterium]|nr:hypothetical protein [Candidatus Saccharimonadales bacterium]
MIEAFAAVEVAVAELVDEFAGKGVVVVEAGSIDHPLPFPHGKGSRLILKAKVKI